MIIDDDNNKIKKIIYYRRKIFVNRVEYIIHMIKTVLTYYFIIISTYPGF